MLARQGLGYAQLAEELCRLGLSESARSVQGKVQRGTFNFTFFLQALVASGSSCPFSWANALRQESPWSWEERATEVLSAELALRPLIDCGILSRRLEEIGVHVASDVLSADVQKGGFAATLYFQSATVCHFEGIQLFLDLPWLYEAVRDAMDRCQYKIGQ